MNEAARYPESYYAASASRSEAPEVLSESISTEICVIGGGYSGLSTVIQLAKKGYKVCVIDALIDKQALWRHYGMDSHEDVEKNNLAEHVATEVYEGALIDHSGGHIHPLKLALGEAGALRSIGGKVFENSEAEKHDIVNRKHVRTQWLVHGGMRCAID